jgi:hypothetical protein
VSKAPPACKLSNAKRNIAVDLWTTQERCPHVHSDNNRRKQLIKINQTNNHPLDCAMKPNKEPSLRPQWRADYFAANIGDPDGYNIEIAYKSWLYK